MKTGVLLIAHGTVDALDELPEFLAKIRRGHAAPPELLAEVRRRYEAIGGQSPLTSISRSLAAKLEHKLGLPVRLAMRLWRPYPREVLEELAKEGVTRVVVVPLAQHSASVYADAVKEAAAALVSEGGPTISLACASNWGQNQTLLAAYANAIVRATEGIPKDEHRLTTVVMSAHSLPKFIIDAGDPYEREFRASAASIAAALPKDGPKHVVAFQSQGMGKGPGGKPMEWLGPDLVTTLDAIAKGGDKHVVVAPVGFLADHVEILYDLDIEARGWANERKLGFSRTDSLNDGDALVDALAEVARPLIAQGAG